MVAQIPNSHRDHLVVNPDTMRKLMVSIERGSLVFLCGAGLSMPQPSGLPSVIALANSCYDKWQPTEALPPALRDDIDKLAAYFHSKGEFQSVFIEKLVPWDELVGSPNEGHATIADLLICRAAFAALSANFDPLIEHWAAERKFSMEGARDGQEATRSAQHSSPLIKFHGCLLHGRAETIWAQCQLADPDVKRRLDSFKQWLNLNLPGKDLLVVGFWTDWAYLNEVIADSLEIESANSVTVIDTKSTVELKDKAPDLWDRLNRLSKSFEHVSSSADDVLRELRISFSTVWAQKFYALGQRLLKGPGSPLPPAATVHGLSSEELYNVRRDGEGVPYNKAARLKEPPDNSALTASTHLRLLDAGSVRRGAWFDLCGRTIRVVNGAGRGLSDMQGRYKEPPAIQQAEILICAGAEDLGVPPRLIASGRGASVVHPAPGGGSRWLTLAQAQTELGI